MLRHRKCRSDGFLLKAVVVSLLIAAICFSCSSKKKESQTPQEDKTDLLSLASVQLPGWQEKETILISEKKDMSKYIGKQADIYFAYGFRGLAARKYENEKSLPMLVEIYEFNSSENAYGIYSFDTVGDKFNIGQDAVYGHGLLRFWKDKMLIRVVAEENYMEVEDDVLAFGRQVDSKILTTGLKPELLFLIPEERQIPDSLHFFHENVCLNNIYYIPESTALCLSDQTKAVTAQYTMGGNHPTRLLLIEYPDEFEAKAAFENFGTSYFQGIAISADQRINIARVGEEEYNAISLKDNFVILVFEALYSDLCIELVAATLAKIEILS